MTVPRRRRLRRRSGETIQSSGKRTVKYIGVLHFVRMPREMLMNQHFPGFTD